MNGPVGFYPEHPTRLRQTLDEHIGRERLGLDPGLLLYPQRPLSDAGRLLGDLFRSVDISRDIVVISPYDGSDLVTMTTALKTPLGDMDVDDMAARFLCRSSPCEMNSRRIGQIAGPYLTAVMLQATGWDGSVLPVGIPRELDEVPGALLDVCDDATVCLTADLTHGDTTEAVQRQDRELVAALEDGTVPDDLPLRDRSAFRACARLDRFHGLRRFGHSTVPTDAGRTGIGAFCTDAL